MKQARGKRKVIKGYVVSDKMQKTVLVEVGRKYRHPIYRKVVKSKKRYKAHDPENVAAKGDLVEIMETRRLSKDKRWRVAGVISKSQDAGLMSGEKPDENSGGQDQGQQIDAGSQGPEGK